MQRRDFLRFSFSAFHSRATYETPPGNIHTDISTFRPDVNLLAPADPAVRRLRRAEHPAGERGSGLGRCLGVVPGRPAPRALARGGEGSGAGGTRPTPRMPARS